MSNYSAVILLDGEQIYNQPTLRSEELIKHNWFELMSRVSDEGYLYISLENNHPLTQQMLLKQTSSPNSLNARRESRLPPYFRTCEVWGDVKAISIFAENLRKSENYLVSGPSNIKDGRAKIIVRIDIQTAGDFVNEMQDVVKMQLLKGKPVFEFRFDQYDI
jgi:primosomal protein N'